MATAFHRLVSAAIMAGGVTLIAAGLLFYTAPQAVGDAVVTPPPRTAGAAGSASPGRATSSPSPVAPRSTGPARVVAGSTAPSQPTPDPTPTPRPAAASRIVVPSLDIDLAIVPGNEGYPLCDVAQWLAHYGQPGEGRTVYLYAHAREGMFGPLLEESMRQNGKGMLGALVQVYTRDGRVHLYEIVRVKRHATDFSIADEVPPGEERLILQTSEGPRGTVPKLQVAARLLSRQAGDVGEANPIPRPRDCS